MLCNTTYRLSVVAVLIYYLFIYYNDTTHYNRYIIFIIIMSTLYYIGIPLYHSKSFPRFLPVFVFVFVFIVLLVVVALSFPRIAEKSLADDDAATASSEQTDIATYIHCLYRYSRRRSFAYGSIKFYYNETNAHVYVYNISYAHVPTEQRS